MRRAVGMLVSEWPRGEIGRRAGFRFLYSQGCVSSTLTGATNLINPYKQFIETWVSVDCHTVIYLCLM
jgi:hypothetical protein